MNQKDYPKFQRLCIGVANLRATGSSMDHGTMVRTLDKEIVSFILKEIKTKPGRIPNTHKTCRCLVCGKKF